MENWQPSPDPSEDHHHHDHNGPSCYHFALFIMGGAGKLSGTLGPTMRKSLTVGEDVWSLSIVVGWETEIKF